VDCEAVSRFASEHSTVAITKTYKYMCSNPGQK
jgi:heterodisulfide reductase subunit A-like polyferredoxin